MKYFLIPFLILTPFFGLSQSAKSNLTTKYAGTYSYGKDVEKGRVGMIIIYPESDSTILFYMDLNRGAPSYNMGCDWGRVKIKNDTGIYYSNEYNFATGCKWEIRFVKNEVIIRTIDAQDNCEFGFGVYADGTFSRTSGKISASFINQEGTKMYFKDLK